MRGSSARSSAHRETFEAERAMLQSEASRRAFLKATGALVVTFSLPRSEVCAQAAGGAKTVAGDEVDGFLSIGGDGRVTIYSGKVDLGTGVRTAIAQMAAEELDVPMETVEVIQGDTALTPDQGPTYGSLSIQNGGVQIRQAAATARRALLNEAANRLNTKPDQLTAADGRVRGATGQFGYGELAGSRGFMLKVDKDAPLKKPADYKVVGTSVPRLDIPAKVTGEFVYMQDFRVPGMLHGRVVRPPSAGAELREIDERPVQSIPGVIRVVRQGNFVGVVAETEWAAIKASRRLKTTWSNWRGLPDQAGLWDHVRSSKIAKDDITSNTGDAAGALRSAAKRLNATYDFAIHTHGSIGPSCAVAEVRDGTLTCWTASQATHNLRKQLAAMLSMSTADVRCIYIEGSGCYGRNGHEDAAADAALLARVVGRPVRVQWMREEEHGWDPKGPPTLVDLRAGLDAAGNIVAWDSEFFIPQGAGGNVWLIAAEHAGLPRESILSPGNIIHNSALPYTIANVKTVCHRLAETPFRPSWIRTPGRMQNTYANEAFMDELAAAAGTDPLEFRLQHLRDPRGAEVLRRLAIAAKWEKRAAPRRTDEDVVAGRGISYVKYELNRTYVGCVADVEVDRRSGRIRVAKFHVVHDCGLIINPDGLRNQIEGNVIQTVSRTLKEELKFDRSHITSLDWATYPILTFPEIPQIEIDLIDRPDERPWGAGEPTAAVVPSAISNAVFDATGVRLRSVPFTPDRVGSALRSI
jgi:CO/xanthine dehydrogenase Mo-binding subunit